MVAHCKKKKKNGGRGCNDKRRRFPRQPGAAEEEGGSTCALFEQAHMIIRIYLGERGMGPALIFLFFFFYLCMFVKAIYSAGSAPTEGGAGDKWLLWTGLNMD